MQARRDRVVAAPAVFLADGRIRPSRRTRRSPEKLGTRLDCTTEHHETDKFHTEQRRRIRIAASPEVLVVGGSPSGVAAAVASARCGARVLLVEQAGFLGGQAIHVPTIGQRAYFDSFGNQIVFGLAWEIIERCRAAGGAETSWADPRNFLWRGTWVDPEVLKAVLLDLCVESGVNLLLDTTFSLPIVTGGASVQGAVVENKSGRQAIHARVTIDATGDADVAARAGAAFDSRGARGFPMEMLFRMAGVDLGPICAYAEQHPEDVRVDPPGDARGLRRRIAEGASFALVGFRRLVARAVDAGDFALVPQPVRMDFVGWDPGVEIGFLWLGRDVVQIWSVRIHGRDGTRGEDLSQAEVESRRRAHAVARVFRSYVPGFAHAYILDTPGRVGVRETRRIVGDYTLTEEDVVAAKEFPDTIGLSAGHDEDTRIPCGHELPFRCLLPRGVENLLVIGRAISVEAPSALNAVRGIVTGAVTGQAAGVAAALAVRHRTNPRNVSAASIREVLAGQGVLLRLPGRETACRSRGDR